MDNEAHSVHIHHYKTAAKQFPFNNDTVAIHIFTKEHWDAPTIAAKIYEKDPQTLAEVIRQAEKLNAVHQLTATLTPSLVSMMSGVDRYFVCGQIDHFGYHCLDAQYYGCDEFSHFARDFPNKIPPSGTPYHQDRLNSRHQYTYTKRDRSHSTYYDLRYGRHFSRSQSCCCSHCDRSSSFRWQTSHSSSSHCSSSHCHLANGHPNYHPHNSYTPSHTCHFSHRYHSCHSTDCNQSHSGNSHCTAQETQPRKSKQHPRPSIPINPIISRLSSSRIPLQILPPIL